VWALACIAGGLALVPVFLYTERSVASRGGHPLLSVAVFKSPGLVSGLATMTLIMVTYGGFLFSFAVDLQAGQGDSALRAGLTCAPCALAFGLCGYFWRRVPASWHPYLTMSGAAIGACAYAAVAVTAIQLSQAVGVAVFGSVFLTLDARTTGSQSAISGHALFVTLTWIAVTLACGVAAAAPLAKTVRAAARSAL
jgi:hypothetical protein